MHAALKTTIGFDLEPYKEYIDNEILVTLAQMDKPSKIFDYLYLVSGCSASNTVMCLISPACWETSLVP